MKFALLTTLFPLFFYSGSPSGSKNKKLLKRFYKEVYVDWDMETADELLSPDFFSHDWPANGQKGPQAFRNYYRAFKKALPDARYEVKDILADGDRVAVHWVMRGTYSAEFPGIEVTPAGQQVTLRGVAIYRVDDGKLAERWVISDLYELLKSIKEPITD